MMENDPHARRQFLARLVRFLFFIGLLAFSWVIISNLTFNHNIEEESTQVGSEVDLTTLKPGQLRKVSLRQREVWIYHRTVQDIAQLKKQNKLLRSKREKYFVFFPYEPKRQCLVNWDPSSRSFYDTCNARNFDLAGHLVDGKNPASATLSVPEYRFVSEHVLLIDAH